MHIFFSGIGGSGIGPLALIAHQAGYDVSGSDKQNSRTIDYLNDHGINNIQIGQSNDQIAKVHEANPIDWLVYSSAISLEQPDSEELNFCSKHGIKTSKRDEFLNFLLGEKNLKLISVAGTHGKSTTTAMIIWLFKQFKIPISYSLGAKISFGDSGEYNDNSNFFVYEADEFDRNFLNFKPFYSIISGVSWDHHEIFKTRDDYKQAFRQFIDQSDSVIMFPDDVEYLDIKSNPKIKILNKDHANGIKLVGAYNRLDGLLATEAFKDVTRLELTDITAEINKFPGLERRMEEIIPNLYSDYAHTPEKIKAAMNVATEIAVDNNQPIYVIYEPLTNRRQHYVKDLYGNVFDGAEHIYWIPSYLAREDPELPILEPSELIKSLSNPTIASPAKMDESLLKIIKKHLNEGSMVIALNGGGGGGIDEWLRKNFLT
jgi:UDP-N-acetylmuramate--alanine ligase